MSQERGPAREVPEDVRGLAADMYSVVAHVHRHLSADLLAAVGELDLSISRCRALHVLDAADHAVSLGELAEAVGLSLPAASRLVDGLRERGLVERHEDPVDRRLKRVRATPDGRDAVRRLAAARLSVLEDFAASLPGEQRRDLAAALRPVAERLDPPVPPAAPGETGT